MIETADSGLELRGLSVARNGFNIVSDVTLHAPLGRVTVLLGPNGAGRTTLVEAISGVLPVRVGAMSFCGRGLNRLSRVQRHRIGIAHVEQGRTIFSDLTVDENLRARSGRADTADAYEWFPELAKRRDVKAASLSGGEQQMLVIARALLGQPRLLMLDELSLGLAPIVVGRLMPMVREIADRGLGVLLVEQYAVLALGIGDSAYVMNRGRIVLEDTCAKLLGSPERLRQAYLL
jgi:branched-chain amino acid transport system ATP-binding protein